MACFKKWAQEAGRTVVWVDESGFYLLPSLVHTYAPVGKTPVLRVPLSREHISIISGITAEGKLYLMAQERAYRSKDVVRFLKHLLVQIPGKILVLWDGASIHRGKEVRDYLAEGGARRIQLESLPWYAPELNPDEGIWNYLKRVELRNVCCSGLEELRREIKLAVARMRHKTDVIRGCFKQAENQVQPRKSYN